MCFGLPIGDNYTSISDEELDFVIADIMTVCSPVYFAAKAKIVW